MDTKQLLEAVETIRVVKSLFDSPQNEWLPVIAAIGGAFVGGISTFVPSYLLELKKRRDERESVTNALTAEVRAILTIIRHRRYLENLREVERALQQGPTTMVAFTVRVSEQYARVYQDYVPRLGLVNPQLAAKIIEFHKLIEAIIQDITPGGEIAEGRGDLEAVHQLIKIAESAVTLGDEIVDRR